MLPTGAGKSLVIAELARVARGRVLVLAHVRELVEQNHAKYVRLGFDAGIYSAGLGRKEATQKTVFASIQSLARASEETFRDFSLLVIDECHRVSTEGDTQYLKVITTLKELNPKLCILGLTATPYRLGFGWIYEYHQTKKLVRSDTKRFFKVCVFELSLAYMVKSGYLTPPIKIDSPVAAYDFSSLRTKGAAFVQAEVDKLLVDQKRITPLIVRNIVELAEDRHGVMLFTSSVRHAQEILRALPPRIAAMVVGDTDARERDEVIAAFKARKLKFLVNVSVLTTGFDAPHVDVIALLRPTESVSLYQQIIGRGLRLSEDKVDCLVLDYTGQGHDVFSPEIEEPRPNPDAKIAEVPCPKCGHANEFWAIVRPDGFMEEHFGRKCRGAERDENTGELVPCGFRFRFKLCDKCGAENDVAARACAACSNQLVDDDKRLKEAMALKDAHVLRVDSMWFTEGQDRRGAARLEVSYHDVDDNRLNEYFYLDSSEARRAFFYNFTRLHARLPGEELDVKSPAEAVTRRDRFRTPTFVIARRRKRFWRVEGKVFG